MDCLVLDTSVISQIIKEKDRELKVKLKHLISHNVKVFITSVSYYEIKRGLIRVGAEKRLREFEELCRTFEVLLLDSLEIFEIASEIHARLTSEGKPLEDADILIASVAIFRGCCLLTRDRDFYRIRSLKVADPDSL